MSQSAEILEPERQEADFAGSLAQLHDAVSGGWSGQEEWPAKFAASVREALAFAVANPAAARALTIESRTARVGDSSQYQHLIADFSERLCYAIPEDHRPSASTDRALVTNLAAVVAEYLRSDRIDRLVEVIPDLIYLTLLPYVGFDEARERALAATAG